MLPVFSGVRVAHLLLLLCILWISDRILVPLFILSNYNTRFSWTTGAFPNNQYAAPQVEVLMLFSIMDGYFI